MADVLPATNEVPDQHPSIFDAQDDDPTDVDIKTTKRYVVTYAQNATGLHDDFFASLLVYCEHTGAELQVIAGRYTNPTSIWSRLAEENDWWDSRLQPYLVSGRLKLAEDLIVYGDVSVRPTAVRPLTGFEVFAGPASAIFGHPKIQLITLAGQTRENSRIFTTTGALTTENYTPSKAGRKAEAHHIYGAAVVEVSPSGEWFLRQINATSDGEFDDLDKHYSPYGVDPAARPLALVMGDIHCPHVEPKVMDATFGEVGINETLKPSMVILHDVMDFRARNHHRIKDADEAFASVVDGAEDVEDEVAQVIDFIDSIPTGPDVVIVASNHDEAFDRWLRESNPNADPLNARFFHEVQAARLKAREDGGDWIPALELVYRSKGYRRARFLRRDESFTVGGIECGSHGDKGVNGSRGSILGYAKLGIKSMIGHGHSGAILDGVHMVGISGKLDQGYNNLPNNWAHAHGLIYENGKRTLLFMRGSRWRAEPSQ